MGGFVAKSADAEAALREAQGVLDLIDETRSEAVSTTVMENLQKAHRRLCKVITFLNHGDSSCGAAVRSVDARSNRNPKTFLGEAAVAFQKRGSGRRMNHNTP